MNLHRADTKPDWVKQDAALHNKFQRLAARTNGVVTPGNIVSVVGFGLVVWGLSVILLGQVWLGIVLLAIGRFLDVIDGMVAEATKTKSPLGEAIDVTLDKAATFLVIATLLIMNIASWWLIVGLLLPQVGAVIVALHQRGRGVRLHPTRAGKLSMVLVWVGVIGLLISWSVAVPVLLTTMVYGVVGLSFLLGCFALWQYAKGG